ncbi:MAG: triose-phosphate isomerase [Alphaproteobacteria bacterium]|nr:triose-phosphate isomerase [Alphaproteobacteria bacterium]
MERILPLVVGNWKMNGHFADECRIRALLCSLEPLSLRADVIICPPATLIRSFSSLVKESGVAIGAQDCHTALSGPYTGDISSSMLVDAGAKAVILGHSERRIAHGETSHIVRKKAKIAHQAGLTAIICIGESEAERVRGEGARFVVDQLRASLPDMPDCCWSRLVIAYEPVWAIGTGDVPAPAELEEVHSMIREELQSLSLEYGRKTRILYGGSVRSSNVSALLSMKNVDGALVGGASLQVNELLGILSFYAS